MKTSRRTKWYQAWRFKKKLVPVDDGPEYDLKLDRPIGPPQRDYADAETDIKGRKGTERYAYKVVRIWPVPRT
ncbi:MAG: hypothetical protein A2854_04470 [Parcubacteria group bacterium RIFCSPHIGHO2_01_FULL_56_18]|nr:MAG: hypothetical protein A2854_04470 [Parcubacteria group bacterium RIFCSPHIGHO2_01_FULL_56_18]